MADLLSEYGVDVNDWFRLRRWSDLMDLIDELPGASRTTEARLNNEEEALDILRMQELAEQAGIESPVGPRLSEYTLEAALLQQLIDHIAHLEQTLIAVHGGKPHKIKPGDRPPTAVDRLKRERLERSQHDLLNMFGRSFNS